MEDRYTRGQAIEEAANSLPSRTTDPWQGPAAELPLAELSAQVYESLEYAQSYLLMSPVAMLHTMEDVGWPLRSVAAHVRRAPTQWPAAEDAFASADTTARFLFRRRVWRPLSSHETRRGPH